MKKSTTNSKTKGTWNPHVTCVVNSCQGKDAGVFRLNYSIYQHALAFDVIQVINGTNAC